MKHIFFFLKHKTRLKDPLASAWLTDPDLWQISVFLQLLSVDNTCFCMTIAFWRWLMNYACMLCTPTHTIPNESHLGEGLWAFSTRGNCNPLSHQNSKIASGTIYFSSAVAGRSMLLDRVPPTLNLPWEVLSWKSWCNEHPVLVTVVAVPHKCVRVGERLRKATLTWQLHRERDSFLPVCHHFPCAWQGETQSRRHSGSTCTIDWGHED